jgi:broad specificity phosphatase PhoE
LSSPRDGDGPDVWIVRHGATAWTATGQHTSRTDLELTAVGAGQAKALGASIGALDFDLVLTSPMQRAWRTAELAGLVPYEKTDDLLEWDYGDLEGRTTSEIRRQFPQWTIWDGPWPDGETSSEVSVRADRLLGRVRTSAAKRVALIGHGHFSRVLAARWVGAEPGIGRWLAFDTASLAHLGWDRGTPVLCRWNLSPGGAL